jgi:16S rRNA (cytidine1402-2'-O)-methyltransferase
MRAIVGAALGQDGDVPLVVAATPIGNVEDASPRLRAALAAADVVAAEDTRRLRRLAGALGVDIAGRVSSYYDAVEAARTPALLAEVRTGRTVLLVTDAGMPLVSDPGYRLVAAAAAEGLPVTVLPGPSAVLAALALSGLPADRWAFEGFLPRRSGDRASRLREVATDPRTTVFFEAPHRLAVTLAAMADAFGPDRPAAVCRELTKTFEEVRRGPLGELVTWAGAGVKGEITIVVAGAVAEHVVPSDAELAVHVRELVAAGMTTRDAVGAVAAERGISKRVVYQAATTL